MKSGIGTMLMAGGSAMLALLTGCAGTKDVKAELTAEQILAKTAKVYVECQTYRDSGEVRTVFIEPNRHWETKKPFTTAFRRPDAFRFEFKEDNRAYIVWRNGKDVKTWWDVQPVVQEVKSLRMALAGATGVSGGSAHNIPNSLMPQEVGGRNIWLLPGVQRVADGELGGHICYRLQGEDKTVLWIGKDDFLLRRFITVRDFRNFRAETVTDYVPVINGAIAPELLAFNLPPTAIGKPAIKVDSKESCNPAYAKIQNGRKLSAEQAAQLEKTLTGTDKDIPVYTELLGYYIEHYEDAALQKKRYETILLMVQKYPHADVMATPPGEFLPLFKDGEKAKALWLEHFKKNPKDVQLRWNAANNMLLTDMAFAAACLKQGKELEPNSSRWDVRLAFVQQLQDNLAKKTSASKEKYGDVDWVINGTAATQKWLEPVDAGKYFESWNIAASYLKSMITAPAWEQTIKPIRSPLGKRLSLKVKNAVYHASLPGVPDGRYVVVEIISSFENKKEALETVTVTMDKDGQWRVAGYFIK